MDTKPQTTSQTRAPAAARICKRPGCTTQLGPNNQIGLCPRHVRWTGTRKERPSAGNGHAAAGSNGAHEAGNSIESKATNGSNGANGTAKRIETIPDLAADRVDQLILSLPVADKTRLAIAWLTRAI